MFISMLSVGNSKYVRYKTVGKAVVNNVVKHIMNAGDWFKIHVYDFDMSYDCIGDILIENIDGFTFRVQTKHYYADCCMCEIDKALKEALEYVIFNAEETTAEETTAEETTAEEITAEEITEGVSEKIYLKNVKTGDIIRVEEFFKMCYITFIDTYGHDIDILNDYFNGDYDLIESCNKEKIIDIINLYIIKWVIANRRLYNPITADGKSVSYDDKSHIDYINMFSNYFNEYRYMCKMRLNVV